MDITENDKAIDLQRVTGERNRRNIREGLLILIPNTPVQLKDVVIRSMKESTIRASPNTNSPRVIDIKEGASLHVADMSQKGLSTRTLLKDRISRI